MSLDDNIRLTKEQFEKSFKEGTLYNRQTQSEEHIEQIIRVLNLKENSKVLDLGTGSGYLAFEIAKRNKSCDVTGLDIVDETLKENRKKAAQLGLQNVSFVSYDGINFPFASELFDCITTRYALHHFPAIEEIFGEISRCLKIGGQFFLSDPTPNENDSERFVDDYMKMKKDGHMKYYTNEEFLTLADSVGLSLIHSFKSQICFPRLKKTAFDFEQILANHNPDIIKSYQVTLTPDNQYIYITQNVLNLLFQKN